MAGMEQNRNLFYRRGFFMWVIIMLVAVIDGWVRDLLLVPLFGNWTALFTSGLIMIGIFFLGAYALFKNWGVAQGTKDLLLLGLMWSLLTFGFEALIGLGFRGLSVSEFLILYHPRDLLIKGETITFGLTLVIFIPLLTQKLFRKT